MNIFVTDSDPIVSARNLDDKRVVKMILESSQMLAYAAAAGGCPSSHLPIRKSDGKPYSTGGAHSKHPCTLWVGKSKGNYLWLLTHLEALCHEYKIRYPGKTHYCESNMDQFITGLGFIPNGPVTDFQNCSLFKNCDNVILAYRATMIDKWKNDKLKPKWTNVSKPAWAP